MMGLSGDQAQDLKTKDFPEEIFEEAFSHEFGQTTAVFDAALSCCAPGAYKRRSQTGPATAQDGPREIQNTEFKMQNTIDNKYKY